MNCFLNNKKTLLKLLAMLLVTSLLSGSFVPLRAGAEQTNPVMDENSLVSEYSYGNYDNCSTGFVVSDFPQTAIFENNSNVVFNSADISEWTFVLAALEKTERYPDEPLTSRTLLNKNLYVAVGKAALRTANKLPNPVLLGLKEDDMIKLSDLIDMYIITRADDVREVLVTVIFEYESVAVRYMKNSVRDLGMKNTKLMATNGAYSEEQITTVHDIHLLFSRLLKYETFLRTANLESANITILRDDKRETILCERSMYDDPMLYGNGVVPEGWESQYRLSCADNKSNGAQAVLAKNSEGESYIFTVGNIPFEKDVSTEMYRLINMQSAYTDADPKPAVGDDKDRYKYLLDSDVEYYTEDNKPKGFGDTTEAEKYMMELTVPVWKYEKEKNEYYESEMKFLINRKVYSSLKAIFEEIFNLPKHFPIYEIKGYEYGNVSGPGLKNSTLMSVHSFGAAVDINGGQADNPYYLGKGNDLRNKDNIYCIPDEVIAIFEKHGWYWGGNFNICTDTMHFQYLGLDYLSYQDSDPFMHLSTNGKMEVGEIVYDAQRRLAQIGYSINQNGIYNNKTRTVIMKFQSENGLHITGEIDVKTWETLINLTHFMDYCF